MKFVLCLVALAAVYCSVDSKYSPPTVQVYSEKPAKYGEKNVLICNVKDFHPPDLVIQLLMDGQEIPHADQTDLAFKETWQFHLTKSVTFTPRDGQKYSCRVTHGDKENNHAWEPNM